jgi:hypothetical protein
MARANTSLPVPVSPVSSTVAREVAARSTSARTSCIARLRAISPARGGSWRGSGCGAAPSPKSRAIRSWRECAPAPLQSPGYTPAWRPRRGRSAGRAGLGEADQDGRADVAPVANAHQRLAGGLLTLGVEHHGVEGRQRELHGVLGVARPRDVEQRRFSDGLRAQGVGATHEQNGANAIHGIPFRPPQCGEQGRASAIIPTEPAA